MLPQQTKKSAANRVKEFVFTYSNFHYEINVECFKNVS